MAKTSRRASAAGVQALDDVAAQLRGVVVDHGDRHGADELSEIGLRIEHAIEKRCQHKQAERAPVAQNAPVFRGKGAEESDPLRPVFRCVRSRRRWGFAGDRPQPKRREAEKSQRQRREGSERLERIHGRHAARRLIEQDLDVPAQRQQRAPDPREAAHRQNGKADAGKAEGGRADDAREGEAESEVAGEQLEKRPDRQIAHDQQASGGARQRGTAAERHLVAAMDGKTRGDQQEHEDAEIGGELADQGRQRIAAGRLEPFAHAARAELRSDGVARGNGDDDVQHGGQDRPQQELGIVEGGIRQHVLFDDQRAGREARRPGRRHRQVGRARRNRGGKRTGRHVARRKVLLVVEDDDLRPLAGNDVALEVARQIDRGERFAGTDGVHGRVEVGGAPGHVHAGRRVQGLDVGNRCLRAVLIDDVDPQIADDGVAESQRQQRYGDNRHGDHERQRDAVMPEPAELAHRDADEPRTERRRHQGRLFQSAYTLMPGRSSGTGWTG